MRAGTVDKCANPACHAEFKRLGTGKLYTLPVSRPQAWGLPPTVKQKVVWLCSRCALTTEVEFDTQHCQVLLVKRERSHRQTA
ncbi:MAG TPA: hypothetical protein VMD98_12830 [Bryocella sp.]|nr:hypothetical protein [Bryocella sp.]